MASGTINPSQQYPLGKEPVVGKTAKPLGTIKGGGPPHPQLSVLTMTFRSDHDLLTDEETHWTPGGDRYGKPEWAMGLDRGHPVSHSGGEKIKLELEVYLDAPKGSDKVFFNLSGKGIGLTFLAHSLLISPGETKTITITSDKKLNETLGKRSLKIKWEFSGPTINIPGIVNRVDAPAFTTRNTMLITAGKPKRGAGEVTFIRLRKALATVAGQDPTDAIAVVSGMMDMFNSNFSLEETYKTPWDTAKAMFDNKKKADCRSIAALVSEFVALIGLDGSADAVLVYPKYNGTVSGKPADTYTEILLKTEPTWRDFTVVAEKAPHTGTIGGLEKPLINYYFGPQSDLTSKPPTVDPKKMFALTLWGGTGANSPNNFEACVRFTPSGRKAVYFPGGADPTKHLGAFDTPIEVLNVMMQSLGWYQTETHGTKFNYVRRDPSVYTFPKSA